MLNTLFAQFIDGLYWSCLASAVIGTFVAVIIGLFKEEISNEDDA